QQQPATLQEQAAVQLPGASRQQQPDNPEGMLCKMKEKVMKILFSMAIIDKGIASDAPCYFVITHSSFKQDDSWCTQNEINTDYPVVTFHQKEDDFYIEHHEKCNKEPYKHSFERGMLIQDETLKDMLFKVYKESEYDKENRLWNTKKPLLLSGKQAFMCKLTAMAILGSKCFSHNYSVDRFKQKLAIESDLSLGKIPLLEIIRTDETRFISEEISLSTINNLMKHSHNTIFHDPLQKLNPNNVILEYIIDTAFCGAMLPEPNYDFYHSRGPHVERTLYFDTLMSLSDRNMFGIKPLSHRQQNSFFVMSIYRDLYKKKHIKENIIAGTAMLTRTFFSLRLECFHAIVAEQLLRKTHQYISENKFSSASLTQEKELGELCCLLYQQLGNFDKYHHDDNLSYDSQRKALQQLRREIGESHMSFFSDKISEFRFAPHKFLTDRVTFFSASSAVFGLSYVAYKSYAAYEAISKVENK
ncbi:MAG: hypothetical protein P1U36_00945, partial [Legionellaceae bacterium]|nr:hypothetical protein [Legionellaceae bacterium]